MTDDGMDWILRARQKWYYTGKVRPAFAEATGPGYESVWDYPRPPRVEREFRRVRVDCDERIVADSSAALKVMETASPPAFYVPPADVDPGCLQEGSSGSICEWKGQATYFSVAGLENCAWTYKSPFPEFIDLAGYIAFYPAALTCWLGDEVVRPQPGGVYGGWITSELKGPFKGKPGTAWW